MLYIVVCIYFWHSNQIDIFIADCTSLDKTYADMPLARQRKRCREMKWDYILHCKASIRLPCVVTLLPHFTNNNLVTENVYGPVKVAGMWWMRMAQEYVWRTLGFYVHQWTPLADDDERQRLEGDRVFRIWICSGFFNIFRFHLSLEHLLCLVEVRV